MRKNSFSLFFTTKQLITETKKCGEGNVTKRSVQSNYKRGKASISQRKSKTGNLVDIIILVEIYNKLQITDAEKPGKSTVIKRKGNVKRLTSGSKSQSRARGNCIMVINN